MIDPPTQADLLLRGSLLLFAAGVGLGAVLANMFNIWREARKLEREENSHEPRPR